MATILLKSISSSDTQLMVASVPDLPYSGIIQIENEIISYTDNFSGTLYNCFRGYQNTTATTHLAGLNISFLDYYSPSTGIYLETKTSTPVDVATTGQWSNFLTLDLPPGDWDITGVMSGFKNSDAAYMEAVVSLYSGNVTTDHVFGLNAVESPLPDGNITNLLIIPNYRLNVIATTTIYLKGYAVFSHDHPQMYNGSLHARRFR